MNTLVREDKEERGCNARQGSHSSQSADVRNLEYVFLNVPLTPEYPEMSSKYRNLEMRLFTAGLSSAAAPLSAFLSFLGFDFFSLKLILCGT